MRTYRVCSVCGGDGWTDGSAEVRRDGSKSTECVACRGSGRCSEPTEVRVTYSELRRKWYVNLPDYRGDLVIRGKSEWPTHAEAVADARHAGYRVVE